MISGDRTQSRLCARSPWNPPSEMIQEGDGGAPGYDLRGADESLSTRVNSQPSAQALLTTSPKRGT